MGEHQPPKGRQPTFSRRDVVKGSLMIPLAAVTPSISAATQSDKDVSTSLRRDLEQDAARAWEFFQPKGKFLPGMLPATSWRANGSIDNYPVLAMWDTGSLILAYISARMVGLLSETGFEERIKGVLSFLDKAVFRWGKETLPNYQTYITDGRILERGYDATDTARLLVSLKILDQYTKQSFGIDKLVSSWGIAATIRDGRIHDIKRGKLISDPSYLYSSYVSRGYDLWNFAHDPLLDPHPLRSEQAKAAFLKKVSSTGVVSTEPQVTEQIELGYSETAKLLADILFQAQEKRFERTGYLTCVSEAPIDAEPWFIYQGYQMPEDGATEGGEWIVAALKKDARWKTEKFARETRLAVSGAAFLWFADRADDYSDRLYQHIREGAFIEGVGFSPGIYEHSKRADQIPDINTNALILESVAYILNGRKPLLEPLTAG